MTEQIQTATEPVDVEYPPLNRAERRAAERRRRLSYKRALRLKTMKAERRAAADERAAARFYRAWKRERLLAARASCNP